jgi:hypothetical protein
MDINPTSQHHLESLGMVLSALMEISVHIPNLVLYTDITRFVVGHDLLRSLKSLLEIFGTYSAFDKILAQKAPEKIMYRSHVTNNNAIVHFVWIFAKISCGHTQTRLAQRPDYYLRTDVAQHHSYGLGQPQNYFGEDSIV